MINSPAFSLSQSKENYQTLKESIQALDITRNKFQKKLSNLDQIQDKTLHKEYSVFIEYLSFRINDYCSQIAELVNGNLPDELPCSVNTNYIQQADKSQYVTGEEKIQSLDNELMNALGDFDEMLLKEDEMIAQTSRNTSAGKASSSSGQNSSGGQQKGKQSENKQENESEEKSEESAQDNQKSKNNNEARGKGKNKGDGSKQYKRKKLDKIDDDIVSRQLKEAAENETNPELKEKLWDEYYKYKQNRIK